jgi:hypothetical protein
MRLSDLERRRTRTGGLRSQPHHDLIKGLDGFAQAEIHSVVVIRRGPLLFEPYSRW